MHGKGKYLWVNGDSYEGEFKNGRKCGYGIKLWFFGRYMGMWYNDVYNGCGEYCGNTGYKG